MEEKMSDMIEQVTIYRVVKTGFTEKERLDMAGQIANCIREKKSNEDELTSIAAQYKSNVKRLEAEISGCAEKLNTGWEMKRQECFEIRDYATGHLSVIRKDNGDIVEERALTGEERQMALFEEGKQPTEEATQISTSIKGKVEALVQIGAIDGATAGVVKSAVNVVVGAKATLEPSENLSEDTNPFYSGKAQKSKNLKMPE